MKRVISTQAIMANGKTTYTGLFTSEGIPAEVELVCVNGNACLSVTIPEDDEEEYIPYNYIRFKLKSQSLCKCK